jgi:hypothetical protein
VYVLVIMERAIITLLSGWTNFYVIVGSSAGALTGLQFVVMTLMAESELPSNMRDVRAFGTPTVIHFCTALLVSAIMAAPWHVLPGVGFCLVACGMAGLAYAISIIGHARKASYTPDTGDWIWYAVLPLAAHLVLLAAAMSLWWNSLISLFVIAAVTLLFLFLGIHNAWDTVTYIATRQHKQTQP